MILLTPAQESSFSEILTIGTTKAAQQLSGLLNKHISISSGNISVTTGEALDGFTEFDPDVQLAFVYHVLTSGLVGRALLVYYREKTGLLSVSMQKSAPDLKAREKQAYQQGAMLEVGNIILSSTMSTLEDILSCGARLSSARYDENMIGNILRHQVERLGQPATDVYFIAAKLDTLGEDLAGNLILALDKPSYEKILSEMATMSEGAE